MRFTLSMYWRMKNKISDLERQVKKLRVELSEARRIADAEHENYERLRINEHKITYTIPQLGALIRPWDTGEVVRATERRLDRITDEMKVTIFDDLLEKGYIRRLAPSDDYARYEITVRGYYEPKRLF